jgi:hypothetical protein
MRCSAANRAFLRHFVNQKSGDFESASGTEGRRPVDENPQPLAAISPLPLPHVFLDNRMTFKKI